MYKILTKTYLNSSTVEMVVNAPYAAKHAQPGQFVVLRVDEYGERIPLTIADYSAKSGTITIIFQIVGKTTAQLALLNQGDEILDFAGPLGAASELCGFKNAAVIGGGAGCAIAYPQAKALFKMGADVDMIAGFRTSDLIILEDKMRANSTNLTVMTDDGSNGNKGFVTAALEQSINSGKQYDVVIAIGPLPMMKAVAQLTKTYGIKTIVSMNPLMIDGTGMCGCCRVLVDGKMKFACVDGPDFDGHLVDFDDAMKRLASFKALEADAYESFKKTHECNLLK
ncbi:MAG: sulfide/dihydroorotate dehydrogenase-like FAD/NAD-binding protein [Oscillospiraceae bacterium]|jgi:ferredoxin--NADP+ reductase|nr:sulfide/dihydroorotate dehydrogenase-like FAD/NAD-binding protein [Oscillospiraceae bacterium]